MYIYVYVYIYTYIRRMCIYIYAYDLCVCFLFAVDMFKRMDVPLNLDRYIYIYTQDTTLHPPLRNIVL